VHQSLTDTVILITIRVISASSLQFDGPIISNVLRGCRVAYVRFIIKVKRMIVKWYSQSYNVDLCTRKGKRRVNTEKKSDRCKEVIMAALGWTMSRSTARRSYRLVFLPGTFMHNQLSHGIAGDIITLTLPER
jgi:hypothetical protein